MKRKIKSFLKKNNFLVIDLGPYAEKNKVDYVDYANQLGEIISQGDIKKGILKSRVPSESS